MEASVMTLITTVSETLVAAIEERHCVRLWYNGGFRVLEPHAYGQGRKGHDLLRAYQTEGHSESGQPVGWKLLIASGKDGLSELIMLDESFPGPRPEYRRNDKAMVKIYAQL